MANADTRITAIKHKSYSNFFINVNLYHYITTKSNTVARKLEKQSEEITLKS